MIINYEKHYSIIQNMYCISNKIKQGEVPIVSIIVLKNKILSIGFNNMLSAKNPNQHAEIQALRKASEVCNSFNLSRSTIYITQEPCVMCIESIINYNIKNIIYACSSTNKNRWHYLQYLVKKKKLDIVLNVNEKKCKRKIKRFFYNLRTKQY